ncbi:MAG: histidine phosphatase family protein [Devosia nanyangense]|uniref:Histidine phosphatase family protein n=1 Tax=Devosia nanyangense TaxID=1228055 RepID=A0A933NZ81_9HYPH|nr:histidine phosphatase family protein [Devosia nanyangense]
MRELLLFRHAKSSWDDPRLTDKERPLAARGRRAAAAMARSLAGLALVPDLVLCSGAKRAQQTLDIANAEWSPAPDTRRIDALYGVMDSDYLAIVAGEGGSARRLMLVGHNPAIQETALVLAGSGDPDLIARVARKFPTASVAVLMFDLEDWSAITAGSGRFDAFLQPPRDQE